MENPIKPYVDDLETPIFNLGTPPVGETWSTRDLL
jgi:hypothetical protein